MFPICEDVEKLSKKSAFKEKFDVLVLGIPHIAYIKKPEYHALSKVGSVYFVERPK